MAQSFVGEGSDMTLGNISYKPQYVMCEMCASDV